MSDPEAPSSISFTDRANALSPTQESMAIEWVSRLSCLRAVDIDNEKPPHKQMMVVRRRKTNLTTSRRD